MKKNSQLLLFIFILFAGFSIFYLMPRYKHSFNFSTQDLTTKSDNIKPTAEFSADLKDIKPKEPKNEFSGLPVVPDSKNVQSVTKTTTENDQKVSELKQDPYEELGVSVPFELSPLQKTFNNVIDLKGIASEYFDEAQLFSGSPRTGHGGAWWNGEFDFEGIHYAIQLYAQVILSKPKEYHVDQNFCGGIAEFKDSKVPNYSHFDAESKTFRYLIANQGSKNYQRSRMFVLGDKYLIQLWQSVSGSNFSIAKIYRMKPDGSLEFMAITELKYGGSTDCRFGQNS